ncbi:putative membrane protein [Streptococcus pneumoniae GA18523]|nr:putative membrane protein [Streptococcus pneumoniae GA18523]EHE15594.1 putative membrane protein [Streptococcus pneumoniae GA19451]EHE76197.1 putative membrane protein [Streptococcus pneumoniae GA11663]
MFLLVVSDPLTLKELYINNLLFFTPLVILIVSLLYSYRFRFSL